MLLSYIFIIKENTYTYLIYKVKQRVFKQNYFNVIINRQRRELSLIQYNALVKFYYQVSFYPKESEKIHLAMLTGLSVPVIQVFTMIFIYKVIVLIGKNTMCKPLHKKN